jgi:hypothetical protein
LAWHAETFGGGVGVKAGAWYGQGKRCGVGRVCIGGVKSSSGYFGRARYSRLGVGHLVRVAGDVSDRPGWSERQAEGDDERLDRGSAGREERRHRYRIQRRAWLPCVAHDDRSAAAHQQHRNLQVVVL